MKLSSILRVALIGGILFSSLASYAQTQAAPTARPKISREEHQQRRSDEMARELNLTPEQKAKFEQTDRTYEEKMKAKRTGNKDEMDKMRQDRIKAHKSILTKEQAAKYDQMEARKQQKWDGRKEHKMEKKGGKMQKKTRTSGQKAPDNTRTREN